MTQSDIKLSAPSRGLQHDSADAVHARFVARARKRVTKVLCMRQGRLANGVLVNYIFAYDFGTPHFEFYSSQLSPTGYASDFFGACGARLSEGEILEAFQVRASRLFLENAKQGWAPQLSLGF